MSLKVIRVRLVKGVRAAETKMVVKEPLEVNGRGLTKARCNALIIKDSVIFLKSAIQTRRNLKMMKPRL